MADALIGYRMMPQDPSFDKHSTIAQNVQPDSNIVVWITEEINEDTLLSLEKSMHKTGTDLSEEIHTSRNAERPERKSCQQTRLLHNRNNSIAKTHF